MNRLLSGVKPILPALVCLYILPISAQTVKKINHQYQCWFSVNSTIKLKDHWSLITDIHVRRNNFLANSSFEFVRAALQYNVSKDLNFATGFGHMWMAPGITGWTTAQQENRIYQQSIYTSTMGKIGIFQRLRTEERWQQVMVNDKFTGINRFTVRYRYLISITLPVFKNQKLPALTIADELNMQTGNDIVYNHFDQNRLFIGIKQVVTKDLFFDLGYMSVEQQKYDGINYDRNHTFRWFFYYMPDWRKKKSSTTILPSVQPPL